MKDPVVPKQLKFMIVGDSGVGKTTVVNALVNEVEGLAMSRSESTNYVDIFFKKLKIKDGAILINVSKTSYILNHYIYR